jgi:hypothetical protein
MQKLLQSLKVPAMLAALLMSPFALAQQAPPPEGQPPQGQPPQGQPPAAEPPPMQQQQAPSVDVSDTQVQQFADAYLEVAELRETYTDQIVQAEDAERATELQQEANSKMIEAVESTGLTVAEYNSIAEAMDADPELRERIIEHLEG